MSGLPKLVPITRREPPPGYRAPVYTDDVAGAADIVAPVLQHAVEAREEEYALAKATVAAAISRYRWWHLSSILFTIRLWIQSWRQR